MNKLRTWINKVGSANLLFVGICVLCFDLLLSRKYLEGVGIFLWLLMFLSLKEQSRLSVRLRTAERRLDWLLQRGDNSWRDFVASEIRDHLQNGRRLDAIKAYKEWHGTTLMEAKREVETIEKSLPQTQ